MSMPSLSKTPKGFSSFSTLNPQQGNLLQQLLGSINGQQANTEKNPLFQSGSNYLQQLLSGSPESMQAFEAPYKRQFHEQTIPHLAELFGSVGAGSSSAFQNALGQAGAGLSENLASLRGNMQMNALPQALGYAQQPFQNLFQLLGMNTQGLVQKPQSFLQQLLGNLSKGLGEGGGMAATMALL